MKNVNYRSNRMELVQSRSMQSTTRAISLTQVMFRLLLHQSQVGIKLMCMEQLEDMEMIEIN